MERKEPELTEQNRHLEHLADYLDTDLYGQILGGWLPETYLVSLAEMEAEMEDQIIHWKAIFDTDPACLAEMEAEMEDRIRHWKAIFDTDPAELDRIKEMLKADNLRAWNLVEPDFQAWKNHLAERQAKDD